MGFHQAGFEVVGVDIEPQPLYPFEFIQANALELSPSEIRREFHAVHAAPPCQFFTTLSALHGENYHGVKVFNLIPGTRDLLRDTGLHYVIENVEGARSELRNPVTLCGSSFGLRVRRHRLFETNWSLEGLPCDHTWQDRHRPYLIRYSKQRSQWSGIVRVIGGRQLLDPDLPPFENGVGVSDPNELLKDSVAMGIDWMPKKSLNQAIPPAYTRHIGNQLKELL